ncbi:MAG: ammonium transporter [Phycisphaerae bacterium]|nr:ammonium transporter [Phycisphaerae bacterium]
MLDLVHGGLCGGFLLALADPAGATEPKAQIDAGSTAWMLMSSAMVLLMVPGLALFYGGMVRRKNVLTTMLHSFVAMAIIGLQWVLIGYCLAFGKSIGGFIGWSPEYIAFNGISPTALYGDKHVPELVFAMFQGKFAIITPALIAGAVAERMSFRGYIAFIVLWSTFVYCPLAHWVWASGGWLFEKGVLDFAGGTVVHIASGVSALVLVMLIGNRRDYPDGAIMPNNLVLTLTGAGLLWFGWFGFNAGSAVAVESPVAGYAAVLAFTTTQTAAAAAALVWMILEWKHTGKPTSLGVASGIVAGLVAITPAAGHVTPMWAIVIGAGGSFFCFLAVQLKAKHRRDDSLDAFGVHGVGGMWGAIATGIFCFTPVAGLVHGGGLKQVGLQLLGVGVTVAFAFVMTLIIGSIVKAFVGLRVTDSQERDGLDITIHGERGYHL